MEITTLSRSELKRQQIITAATSLFMEKGFPNTSMDQIAKLAEVSKQTVYSHFKDKNNLFVETVTAHCSSSNLRKEQFEATQTLEENLLRVLTNFISLVFSPEALRVYDTCVAHKDEYPELALLFYEAAPKVVIQQVETCLQSIAAAGLLTIENPKFATLQLLGMTQGDWKLRHALGHAKADELPPADYIADCVTRFIKMYR
ncbi:TetR/AcrR family transcriptional regulator [Pseudoalteromonas prydzensis]|uniref:TetR/AcrR family transcriptional regulator n=1 Tax=Pseudoalteromonas prydzensis TaxID=182141 RepID=UPI0007E50E39|nr:TetR/AcrR family transcriptional regulator [Pseudoalteromonas prydzensis]MBE0380265.1 TetR/AcrR family transcriptional regulator, mexJK operon transcriptional repressor [Pseudoalteromonas prydzensis ACAM 620]